MVEVDENGVQWATSTESPTSSEDIGSNTETDEEDDGSRHTLTILRDVHGCTTTTVTNRIKSSSSNQSSTTDTTTTANPDDNAADRNDS